MSNLDTFDKSAEIYTDVIEEKSELEENRQNINESKELISDAVTKITLSTMPFFGVLLSSTDRMPSNTVDGIVGTNGDDIIYNINEIPYCSLEEVEFALTHACMHIGFEHFIRGQYFEGSFTDQWHKACDIVINNKLTTESDVEVPSYALTDLDEYRGDSAEQVRDDLSDSDVEFYEDMQAGNDKQTDSHYTGPSNGTSSHEKVRDRLEQAHEVTKGRGTSINALSDRIEGFNENKVKWDQILHNFVGEKVNREEYSLSPPDRQFMHLYDACIPTMRGREIGNVIISVDTSGSIYENQLKNFIGEIEKLNDKVSEITALLSNTVVYDTIKPNEVREFLKNNDEYHYQSGGTSHVDVFETIRDDMQEPELFVGLTDGETKVPDWTPSYPVLWVLTEEGYEDRLSFGTKTYIPDEEENSY